LDIFFADDSKQLNPTRPGMGPLVASGGVYVSGDSVRDLEAKLNDLCANYGFPANEEFKWSPGRECWMRENLLGEARTEFFCSALSLATENSVKAIVVVEDLSRGTATGASSAEMDVTKLLLERVHQELEGANTYGIFISDRPGGNRDSENQFLSQCLETLLSGTDYVQFHRLAVNAVSTPSKLIRLIQLADLVTSCTTALIAGESRFAPTVFVEIKKLLVRQLGRVGGCGLKIHPDNRYANLYHWLANDEVFVRYPMGVGLPMRSHPYYLGPDKP
jgi:hypothetical protein